MTVDPSVWEIAGQIANMITAFAAAFAAWHAWKGLSAWRVEMNVRRRAEIAEKVLADFYRVRDVYQSARAPFVSAGEMVPDADEKNPKLVKESSYAPLRRLQRHDAFLASFHANQYSFAALFGDNARIPYKIVFDAHNEIYLAVQELLESVGLNTTKEERERMLQARKIAFRYSQDDKIGEKLDEAFAMVEELCRPAIEARDAQK